MEETTYPEYMEDIRQFFQMSDQDEAAIKKAAKTQMMYFTIVHESPVGVFCMEENGDDWFRISAETYRKIVA